MKRQPREVAGLSTVVAGDGAPTLFLHGLGVGAWIWDETIEEFAGERRIVAPDLVGFGRSSGVGFRQSAGAHAVKVREMMTSLGHRRFDIVANSMGAWIALLIARQWPVAVDRIVAVAPAFVFGVPTGVTAHRLAELAGPSDAEGVRSYLERTLSAHPITTGMIEETLERRRRASDADAIMGMARSIVRGEDTFDDASLAEITASVLVVHGSEDGVVSSEQSRAVADSLANSQFLQFDRAGHWPQVERPARFIGALREFLS